MTSISSLPVIRSVTVDDGATAAAQAAAQAATAVAGQDVAATADQAADPVTSRSAAHQSIDQRIDALVARQRGDHAISADLADELKQLLAGGAPASTMEDAAGSDPTATTATGTSTSFGDQLDALSKSLDKLRTSLTRHAAYGAGGTGGDGGLLFDRLA